MKEEYVDIVDDGNNFVRKERRSKVRSEALLHKVARMIIRNNKGQFFVYKRSKKADIHPGLWSVGIGETLSSGEDYEPAALRGMKEELGIKNIALKDINKFLLFEMKYRSTEFNTNYKVYDILCNVEIVIEKKEIEEIKWLSMSKVKEFAKSGKFSPSAREVFRKYTEIKIKNA